MPRVNLDPAKVERELAEFQRHVADGLGVLRRVGEVRPGATARSPLMQQDGVTLYRYGDESMSGGVPILIVYALVNRPEMADLERGRSLVAALLARGFDVYLIDWGYPTGADRLLGLADYLERYLDSCVDFLRERLAMPAIPLLGICQGGTFSACYAALHAEKVSHLITTVTPIDFHTADDMLSHLVRAIDIDALVAAGGNVSGDLLNALFLSLKPYRLVQQKYLRFLAQLDVTEATATFLRMEQWIFDSPALPAAAGREFARAFYQDNRLVKGELMVGEQSVNLRNLTMPLLNIYARNDHLVPPAASRALGSLVGSEDYTEAEISGGHIGIYVSVKAERSVPSLVDDWLRARLGGHDGPKRSPQGPGGDGTEGG